MHHFLIALRAEIIKGKHSLAVWLSIAGTLGNTVIFFVINWFDSGHHPFASPQSPWEVYVLNHYDGIAFMMLPLYVIILATLLTFMEQRSGTWPLIMSLPTSRGVIYGAKFAFGLLLFVGAHFLFILGMMGTGWLMGWWSETYELFLADFPWRLVAHLAAKTILSITALWALHLWLSLRFGHFIIPLTIGILGFVFTTLLTPEFPWQWINPYAYPILYMPVYQGQLDLPSWGWWDLSDGMSLLWGVFFLLWGIGRLQKTIFH